MNVLTYEQFKQQLDAVVAECVLAKAEVVCWAKECDRIVYRHTNQISDMHQLEAVKELHVVGYYQDTGIWSVGIAPVTEGATVPAWPSAYQVHENGYSPMLTLEVPDDTQLVMADEDED